MTDLVWWVCRMGCRKLARPDLDHPGHWCTRLGRRGGKQAWMPLRREEGDVGSDEGWAER